MDYFERQDIENILEIIGLSENDFAKELDVSRLTFSNWVKGKTSLSEQDRNSIYEFAFRRGIRINKIKEQLYREELVHEKEILLFHGAKTKINEPLSLEYSRKTNDFGKGFYCGESLEQSAMFVSNYDASSLYMLKFEPGKLKHREFSVNQEWMLMVAYCRGRLSSYENSKVLQKIIQGNKGIDYIIAPIADNRMYEIIDSFIDGEITDVQCQHCLSATNLGMQYVFVSKKALNNLTILERCFLANSEKKLYISSRKESVLMNMDKVKLAKKQYRNQGNYIEDILK